MATTYYAEAEVTATGEIMCDAGLTASQIEQLREVERQGRITNLIIEQEINIVAAFRNSVEI